MTEISIIQTWQTAYFCSLSASQSNTVNSVNISICRSPGTANALMTDVYLSNLGHCKFQLDEVLVREYKRWLILCQLYCFLVQRRGENIFWKTNGLNYSVISLLTHRCQVASQSATLSSKKWEFSKIAAWVTWNMYYIHFA